MYSRKWFEANPEEAERPGVLYCVVLVDRDTNKRECLKVGIASGKNWKDVLKRSQGFTGYDIRIQRTYADTIYNVWKIEQELHERFKEYKYTPTRKFGGYTELFEIRKEIIAAIPKKK